MGEGAIEAHTRARDLFQATEDRHGAAQAWNNLGSAVQRAGRVEEAVRAHGVALQIYREFEDWYRRGLALRNLALAHEDAHRPAEARAQAERLA
ncbi:tetratricopeptide repeat protein [Streptomyces sp. NPDC001868]|uniref:tetratricopeptide repeat protein n=1 Tax=Streptomyces sp. NPDC001868 TaxID=3154401 RepID=UPI003319BD87